MHLVSGAYSSGRPSRLGWGIDLPSASRISSEKRDDVRAALADGGLVRHGLEPISGG